MHHRALVVEDSADLRLLFSQALKYEQIEVVSHANADEALEFLQQCEISKLPELALIDLTLEGTSGAELVTKIRCDSKAKDIKILLVSGWKDLASIAQKVGADGFLRKPFDLNKLAEFLNQWGLRGSAN